MSLDTSRIIGNYSAGKQGNLLWVTAGVHGNEPSGVIALQRVFKVLEEEKPKINGRILGICGNLKALQNNKRFVDQDLNRTWTKENLNSDNDEVHEINEMFDIVNLLEQYPEKDFNQRYFLDCHTTSSPSIPYSSVQDVNDNLEWGHQFPAPIIKGFSDIVSGSIDHYFSRIGMTGFTFEAGQHTSKDAIDYHEGMIWLALKNGLDLSLDSLSKIPKAVTKTLALKKHQKVYEIIYRHGLNDSDDFKMQEGYKNFQNIEKGELLAIQNNKEVYSSYEGSIFMPLYQSQGNDGFFIVKEVS